MSVKVGRMRVHDRMLAAMAREEEQVEQARVRAEERRQAEWRKLSQLRAEQARLDLAIRGSGHISPLAGERDPRWLPDWDGERQPKPKSKSKPPASAPASAQVQAAAAPAPALAVWEKLAEPSPSDDAVSYVHAYLRGSSGRQGGNSR